MARRHWLRWRRTVLSVVVQGLVAQLPDAIKLGGRNGATQLPDAAPSAARLDESWRNHPGEGWLQASGVDPMPLVRAATIASDRVDTCSLVSTDDT